jgi:hypothetical protein
MGAAYEAAGISAYDQLPAAWNRLRAFQAKCPCAECADRVLLELGCVAVHLNDNHRWTREQIADWVETIEKRLEAEGPEPSTQHLEPVCGPRDSEARPVPEPAVLLETVGI